MKKKALVMLLVGAMLVMGGCGATKVENTEAVKETVVEETEAVEPTAENVQTEEVAESDVTTLPLDNEEYPVETNIPADVVTTAIDNFHNNSRVMITGNVVENTLTGGVVPGIIMCNRDTGVEYMLASDGTTEINIFFDQNTGCKYYATSDVWLKIIPDEAYEPSGALVDTIFDPYVSTADAFDVTEAQDSEGTSYYRATCNYVDESGSKYMVAVEIAKDELLPVNLAIYEVQDEATVETDEATITGENFVNPISTFEISYSPEDDSTFDEMTALPADDDCMEILQSDFDSVKEDYKAEQELEEDTTSETSAE